MKRGRTPSRHRGNLGAFNAVADVMVYDTGLDVDIQERFEEARALRTPTLRDALAAFDASMARAAADLLPPGPFFEFIDFHDYIERV